MARNFDQASGDFIDFGNLAALDLAGDEVTLSIWVRPTGTAERKCFAKWRDSPLAHSYLLTIQADGTALFAIDNGGVVTAAGTTDLSASGQWHHIAAVYDGSNIMIYVDGTQEDSTATTGNLSSTTAPVVLGAGGSGSENPFDGDLGHGAAWDVGLSASEVASLAAGVSPLRMRRDNLSFYAPVNGQSPELDVVGGASGTVTGTTVVEEPPIPNSIVAP